MPPRMYRAQEVRASDAAQKQPHHYGISHDLGLLFIVGWIDIGNHHPLERFMSPSLLLFWCLLDGPGTRTIRLVDVANCLHPVKREEGEEMKRIYEISLQHASPKYSLVGLAMALISMLAYILSVSTYP